VRRAWVFPLVAITAIVTACQHHPVKQLEAPARYASRSHSIVVATYSAEGPCWRDASDGRPLGPKGVQLRLHIMPIRKVAAIIGKASDREILFANPTAQDVTMAGAVCSVDFDTFVRILSYWFQVEKTQHGVRVGDLDRRAADCLVEDDNQGIALDLTGGAPVAELVELIGGATGREFLLANPDLEAKTVGGAACFKDFDTLTGTLTRIFHGEGRTDILVAPP
jgi:hypothetical protein